MTSDATLNAAASPLTLRLPNGLEVCYQSRVELQHFYLDIFEKEVYLRHGLELPADATVFDVGANVGLFTLFVQHRRPSSRVYAFEPAPPLFALLRANAARHAPNARLFNCGVAAEAGSAQLTFYPKSSGMSSFHADREEERRALQAVLVNEAAHGVEGAQALLRHSGDYLDDRLQAETFTCPLVPLCQVIREQQVARIDLLKIDVQKSELAVLQGLAEEDWPRVGQIVIEVHDLEGRAEQVSALLRGRGFEVVVEQDELYRGSEIFNLYARRPGALRPAAGEDATLRHARERAARQRQALHRPPRR